MFHSQFICLYRFFMSAERNREMKNKLQKLTLWEIAVMAAVMLIVRIWQLSTAIDYDTGFFIRESGFLPYLLYVLLGVQLVACIVLITFDSKRKNVAITRNAQSLTPNQVLVIGVSLLAGAVFSFLQLTLDFTKTDLAFFVNVLVFLTYLIAAFLLLSRKKVRESAGFVVIVLPVSYTLKAGTLFMSDTVIVRVSDELLPLLTYIAAVMFFLCLGRYLSGSEAAHSRHKMIFFACAAFVLSTVSTAVKYPMYLIGNPEAVAQMKAPQISELGIWAVSLAVLVVLYQKNKDGVGFGDSEAVNEPQAEPVKAEEAAPVTEEQ